MAIKYLNITVTNKKATFLTRQGDIVCGNSDYRVRFAFDSEWDGHDAKVARFIWGGHFTDVEFSGNEVDVPVISGATEVKVGVYTEGDGPHTTTSATIPATPSVLCEGGTASLENDKRYLNEAKEVLEQCEEVLEEMKSGGGGGASVEVVQTTGESTTAVMSQKAITESFVPQLPVKAGATSVYVTTPDGKTDVVPIDTAGKPVQISICAKLAGGMVNVGNPKAGTHAIPLGFADGRYVQITPNKTWLYQVYCNNPAGTAVEMLSVNHALSAWSIARRYDDGRLKVAPPVLAEDATPKSYVDAVYRHDITLVGGFDYQGTTGYMACTVYSRKNTAWTYDGYDCTLTSRTTASGMITTLDGETHTIVGLAKGEGGVSYFIYYVKPDGTVEKFNFYDGLGTFTDTVTQMI